MAKNDKRETSAETAAGLRLRAEKELRLKGGEKQAPRTDDETRRLLHELQVHQVELEMQNEELRRAREELENALERYTDLYEFAPVGYLTLDRDGFIRAANLTVASFLGIARSTLIGRRFGDFIDIHDLPFFSYFLRKFSTGNAKDSCELTLRGSGDSPVFIRIEAVSSPSAGECRLAVIDITNQKSAEEKLRKSEQRLAEAQGVAHVGSWEWDSIADEISVSDEFNRIFGRVLSIYESFIDMVHPDDRDTVNRAVRGTIAQQAPYDIHFRIVRPDGAIRVIHALGKALTVDTGKRQGMVGTVQDVTELKEMANKLEILNAELTAHGEELEAANTDLEAFNYSVSHDLRSYLAGIYCAAEVLLDTCATGNDEEHLHFLTQIKKACEGMSQLIASLLEFSLMSRSDMALKTVDLSSIASSLTTDLRRAEPERRCKFMIQEGIKVSGDPNLLRIALTNLLGNAWKFSTGKEESSIEFGKTKCNGKPAFYVRDNGVGFDMSLAEMLFTPFHRLHSRNEFDGHGIGLSTVERIIRRHGGRIWAESEPGKGATFYFTLSAK
jgi:PAS domain S-box-containing protein